MVTEEQQSGIQRLPAFRLASEQAHIRSNILERTIEDTFIELAAYSTKVVFQEDRFQIIDIRVIIGALVKGQLPCQVPQLPLISQIWLNHACPFLLRQQSGTLTLMDFPGKRPGPE